MKHLNKTIAAAALGSIIAASATPALADGSLSATSSNDSALVSLTIPALFQITGLDTIDLGTYAVGVAPTGSDTDVCIYTNTVGGAYNVTSSVGDADGAYLLNGVAAGNTSTIAYTVTLNGTNIPFGGAGVDLGGANTANYTCGGAGTDVVAAGVTEAAIQGAQADDYQDTLVLTIASQ